MAVEIERKFLVNKELWEQVKPNEGQRILQGYLLKSVEKTVRLRTKGGKGYITVKGASVNHISRAEFEYEIPLEEAQAMLDEFCPKKIDKVRYTLKVAGKIWEVDEFSSPNPGLILAEIELTAEDESFEMPEWAGKEVSDDERYYNANML